MQPLRLSYIWHMFWVVCATPLLAYLAERDLKLNSRGESWVGVVQRLTTVVEKVPLKSFD